MCDGGHPRRRSVWSLDGRAWEFGSATGTMQTEWNGDYLDGQTAIRRAAAVRLLRGGLEITTETGHRAWWPYGEVRQTQGFYEGQEIRLERGGQLPEVLLIRDAAFLSTLHRAAPESAGPFHDPSRRRRRVALTALAALAVVGITTALYLWGIPGMVSVVATRVPPSWEERLGRSVSEHLAPEAMRCNEMTRARAIQDVAETLLSTARDSPYTFRVIVVNSSSVNALAAPGGYVVVFRGLLERTQTAEELAGVLAHEFQHILFRHTTRALLRHASTGLLLAAITGDMTEPMAYGLESARILGELRYSRLDEDEADRAGLRMLVDAGVDPAGMIAFFERLATERPGTLTLPPYLSTHPSTEGRLERLRLLDSRTQPLTRKLLHGVDWQDIRHICEATNPLLR
jgi:beta-barrel assembly-enhancing protease